MNEYQQYIHKSRYARFIPEEHRREQWPETVRRYIDFFVDRGTLKDTTKADAKLIDDLFAAIHDMEVMPSMRALMTAGEALRRDNVAGFNCSYITIDHPRAFDELLYILMCGTGVGFSVERQYINQLPEVAEELFPTDTTIVVPDSKIGWAKSYRELISLLYSGHIPSWDMSKLRLAGAPLRTFGGRSSGPDPLISLFQFTVDIFKGAVGRKLNSLECHDLCCKIAQCIVVGGVRRSALISLSNLTDDRIRRCKQGQFWIDAPHRALSNNSVCYTEKPDFEAFLKEWHSLYKSRSGERGVFSREASKKQAARNGRRETDHEFGTNPCSEIILRPNQFCNLSEVIVHPKDTLDDLKKKVEYATILGTLQATLTDFRYLRPKWKKNTEEEALLGVSLSGIKDHPHLSGANIERGLCGKEELAEWLYELRQVAVRTNKKWATKLGINQSAAITCVKPSGTVSQLVDCASGIHGRFSPYYIRRVRADIHDPMSKALVEAGVPHEVDVTSPTTLVFSFAMKSPAHSVMAADESALQQLEIWSIYQEHWCEHKPSITVYYKDEEFLDVGQWLYNNFDDVSGVSFLPHSNAVYQQAPYEAITKEQYTEMKQTYKIDWDVEEMEDTTEASQTLACVGGSCEL